MVMAPMLGRFIATYPAITLDVSVKDGSIDLTSVNSTLAFAATRASSRTSIAVRVSPRLALSPSHPRSTSRSVERLKFRGTCSSTIAFGSDWRTKQLLNGSLKGGRKLAVPVDGSLIVDNVFMSCGLLAGVGLGYLVEPYVDAYIRERRLVPVLEDWSPRFSGWHIYYPGRRQMQTPLKVFIEFIRCMNSLS